MLSNVVEFSENLGLVKYFDPLSHHTTLSSLLPLSVLSLFYLILCHGPCILKKGQTECTSVSDLRLCFLCQASQKELAAMETMTAAFIHKFPRVTPELFVDLSQFIPFMSVSDIMNFPASLIVNDSV